MNFRRLLEIAQSLKVSLIVVGVLSIAFLIFSLLVGMPPIGYVLIVGFVAVPTLLYVGRSIRADTNKLTDARFLLVLCASILVMLPVIQAVPYGRAHSNPPITGEPQWSSPRTRELMSRACFGCHSNEVEYPSYASVAPISWVVEAHVAEGREKVNFSEFDQRQRGADETIEVIQEGSMPPAYYTRFGRHPEAKLTSSELQELIDGLRATPGLSED
ncbi:MAG: heme-binding domain-containing protein [Actinobacteria bacterium]|nr:heme-binding domain-containing protein [Actinomycetota bacterium]